MDSAEATGILNEKPLRHVRQALPHDSAVRHVQGNAHYIDDIREPEGTLHIAIGMAPKARGRITALDLAPVRDAPGIVTVLTAADIPGPNDVSPAMGDDPMFAEGRVDFHGQALFAVVATTRDAARRAARKAHVEIDAERPSVTVEDAEARNETVLADYGFGRGDADGAIAQSPHRLEGSLRIGGQEHFYLEGQAALQQCRARGRRYPRHLLHPASHGSPARDRPGAGPARCLLSPARCGAWGAASAARRARRRNGAAIAALGAKVTGRPCKIRLDRDDRISPSPASATTCVRLRVGYDDDGVIAGLQGSPAHFWCARLFRRI